MGFRAKSQAQPLHGLLKGSWDLVLGVLNKVTVCIIVHSRIIAPVKVLITYNLAYPESPIPLN